MAFTLPDNRFGMTGTRYNLGVIPSTVPEYDILAAANRLNEVRYQNLTHKQRMFVDAYLGNDFDATKAALEAGFAPDEAERVGRKMLKKPDIILAIQYALEYFSEKQKLRFQRIVDELTEIALTPINQVINPITVRPIIDADDSRWKAVASVKRTETKYGTNVEFKMIDKLGAMEKLIKILRPDLAKQLGEDDETKSGTVVNVQTINIIPVPSGQFLPAPESPYADKVQGGSGSIIEHSQFDRVAHQAAP